jgi:putative transcriptional regulator
MVSEDLYKGQLLVAEPSIIGDDSFNRAVVLLAEHSLNGSIGFILNKPLAYTLHDLIPEVDSKIKIHNGGPVEQDNLYYIHNVPELITNSIEISNGIYWGGDFEITKKLLIEGKISYRNIKFFLGYSGWDQNQLENEISENAWIPMENSLKNKIIGKAAISFWKEKIKEIGGDYLVWYNAPENPYLN